MSAGWLFRASWPILDPARTLSMLRTEACEHIDDIARHAGCRIVGDITWTVTPTGSHLVAQAAAVPTPLEAAA